MHIHSCIFTGLFLILYGKYFLPKGKKRSIKIYANLYICVYFYRSIVVIKICELEETLGSIIFLSLIH